MRYLNHLKNTFALDLRSLALYRFLIGLVVMADVLYRWEDLAHFYTDFGIIPRSIFINELSMPWSLSFHLGNGSYGFTVVMFSLHLIFGLMLVFGYKTRWAILGAYFMTVSVHNRNWLVNNGGDDVLRAILFYSIFLPLNKRFSLDSSLSNERRGENRYLSTWGFVFFLQVFCIYFVSYILKDSPIWRSDFSAFFYSSRLDIFATPLGVWLRNFPSFGSIITFLSVYLEWLGPIIFIFSFVFGRHWWKTRVILVVLFILFHFGIFLTMNIGLFTFICESIWIMFLPSQFWDQLETHFKSKKYDQMVIYYDAECGFCFKAVRGLREFFLFNSVVIKTAQENNSIYNDMKSKHSWVTVNEKGERFFYFEAFLELLRHSPWGRFLIPILKIRPIFLVGEFLYKWVSHHRPTMGKLTQFLQFSEQKNELKILKWVVQGFGIFIFITLLVWNLTTIKKYNFKSPFFQTVSRWLHIYQEWNMFAPYPKQDNIWVEVPGVLSDGSEIELITGSSDVYSIKDQAFYQSIKNEHWRKFYLNMSEKSDYARYYAGYLCRLWNDKKRGHRKTTLKKFEVIVFSQLNLADGTKGGISRKLSWRHWCFDEDFKKAKLKK